MTNGYADSMTIQIAVKMPDELAAAADELVSNGTYPSRSELARQAIEALVAEARRHAADRAYREAYTAMPDTPEEQAEAEAHSLQSIAEEPWTRWW